MKKLMMLGTIAALGGCSQQSDIEEAVRENLIDPDSAKFGEFSIVESETGRRACATVNAKNRMGGYTGDKQMTLLYDDELGEWAVYGDWEFTHAQCVEVITEAGQEAEPADEDPNAMAEPAY